MNSKAIGLFVSGALVGSICVAMLLTLGERTKMTKVHTLKAPLIVVSNVSSKNMHLLPAGTTLYFDQSFPEGFTRYKVYINIDRMPLPLRDLADPTEVDPIEARALSKPELAKALRDYPLTRQDLEEILQSRHLSRQEISEVFTAYLESTK